MEETEKDRVIKQLTEMIEQLTEQLNEKNNQQRLLRKKEYTELNVWMWGVTGAMIGLTLCMWMENY